MSDLDPHPPTRQCNCPKCLASFDDTALDPENVAAVSACLGDDAAMLRDTHPEAANNMDAASTLIERLYELVAALDDLKCPQCKGPGLLHTCVWCGSSNLPKDAAPALPELLQRQPPKGWGIYLVPNAPGEILISKPNGDGVRVTPQSDPLLFELAWAMLPKTVPSLQEIQL